MGIYNDLLKTLERDNLVNPVTAWEGVEKHLTDLVKKDQVLTAKLIACHLQHEQRHLVAIARCLPNLPGGDLEPVDQIIMAIGELQQTDQMHHSCCQQPFRFAWAQTWRNLIAWWYAPKLSYKVVTMLLILLAPLALAGESKKKQARADKRADMYGHACDPHVRTNLSTRNVYPSGGSPDCARFSPGQPYRPEDAFLPFAGEPWYQDLMRQYQQKHK